MPKVDFDRVATLLGIVEKMSQHPAYKNIVRAANVELRDINNDLDPDQSEPKVRVVTPPAGPENSLRVDRDGRATSVVQHGDVVAPAPDPRGLPRTSTGPAPTPGQPTRQAPQATNEPRPPIYPDRPRTEPTDPREPLQSEPLPRLAGDNT